MNIKQYTLLLLLFLIQTAPAQNFSYLRTTIDNDTILNKKEEYRDSMDSRWWAGLGTGIYFSNQDRFYQRMIIILTSEYRLENIPSLLFEAQWWNSNKGKKNPSCLAAELNCDYIWASIIFS